jgi:hypothetical protein
MASFISSTEGPSGFADDCVRGPTPGGTPMVLIVVILLVDLILIPLIDLVLSERVRLPVKIGVLAVTFIWVMYVLIKGKMMLGL